MESVSEGRIGALAGPGKEREVSQDTASTPYKNNEKQGNQQPRR